MQVHSYSLNCLYIYIITIKLRVHMRKSSNRNIIWLVNQSIDQSINNRLIMIKADNRRNCDDKRVDS